MDFPWLFPLRKDLIIPTHAECMSGMVPQLATWLILGDVTRTTKFQRKAQSCSWLPGGRNHHGHMTHSLESGLTGVMNGTPIPFLSWGEFPSPPVQGGISISLTKFLSLSNLIGA